MRVLNCRNCGRGLIRLDNDGEIKASNAIIENIQSDAPHAGDIFHLTCKCGVLIIGTTPDYLVEVCYEML